MAMVRPCQHPHHKRGTEDLAAIPRDPLGERLQLVLYTEMGPLPYCGMDNLRAMRAADNLGRRHIEAGTVTAYDIVPGEDYLQARHALPQLVVAGALAEAEERFCVADSVRKQIAERRY